MVALAEPLRLTFPARRGPASNARVATRTRWSATVVGDAPVIPPRSVTLPGAEVAVDDDVRFVEFVQTNMPSLSRTAFLLTGRRVAAEDLVQETLVRLYRRKDRLLAAEAPLAYARRALTNQFVNDRRRASSHEIVLADLPEGRHCHPDTAGALAERDAMWQLLTTLPDRQRAAIVLRYYDDLPDEEIAAALDARLGTVRSLISRGLAALRSDPSLSRSGGERA